MREPIRVGFLGAGNLNTIQHYPNIASSEDAEFYAVCVHSNVERMKKNAGPYNPKVMTTNCDEMLADPKVDIVWIAAPPDRQAGLARRALEARKNTFVEKPMAGTTEECVELGKLAKDKDVCLYTGFNRRYAPAHLDLKSMMTNPKQPPLMWYRIADDSHGRGSTIFERPQLLDEACHIFDLLAFLADSEPVAICGFSASLNNDMITIKYENGAVAQMASSIQSSMAWPKERIEVLLDNAAVAVEDMVELETANVPGWGSMIKRYQGFEYPGWLSGYRERMEWEGLSLVKHYRRKWLEISDATGVPDWPVNKETDKKKAAMAEKHKAYMPPVNYMVNKGWCNADHAILKSLRLGTPCHAATARDGARSIACAHAAVEACKTGKVVNLDPDDWAI